MIIEKQQLFQVSTLEEQRIELKLGLLFKIVHNLCHFPNPPELRGCHSNLRYPHALQLKLPLVNTSAYHYSFFPHTMSAWNSLDNPCIASTNYKAFMKHLRTNKYFVYRIPINISIYHTIEYPLHTLFICINKKKPVIDQSLTLYAV